MSGPPGGELQPFTPENPLEEAILAAHEGRSTRDEMLRWLVNSTVLVASTKPVSDGDISNFWPLMMGNETMPLVSLFTAPTRQALYADLAQHMLVMKGGEYFQRMPAEWGVVVNPGSIVQFPLTPVELADIRAKITFFML